MIKPEGLVPAKNVVIGRGDLDECEWQRLLSAAHEIGAGITDISGAEVQYFGLSDLYRFSDLGEEHGTRRTAKRTYSRLSKNPLPGAAETDDVVWIGPHQYNSDNAAYFSHGYLDMILTGDPPVADTFPYWGEDSTSFAQGFAAHTSTHIDFLQETTALVARHLFKG